jgi:ABC-type glycerol-3-phosphate transport system substrate-binding protein
MRLNDDYVRDYAVRGLLLPLDDYIKKANIKTERFIPAFWSWPKVNGKHMPCIKGRPPR